MVAISRGAARAVRSAASTTDGLDEGEDPLVEATEHDQLGVEDVDQVPDAQAQPPADLRQGAAAGGVAGGGPLREGVDHGRPGGAVAVAHASHQGGLPGLGLPAAGGPAPALDARRVDQHVARLACVTGGTQQRLAVDDGADADTDLAGDVHQVPDRAMPPAVLAPRSEVGLVGHHHRDVERQLPGKQLAERDVPPPEVGGEVDEPVGATGDPHHGDPDPGQGLTGPGATSSSGSASRDTSRTVSSGRSVAAGTFDAQPVVDVAAEPDGGHRHRVDRQLDGEDRGRLAGGSAPAARDARARRLPGRRSPRPCRGR